MSRFAETARRYGQWFYEIRATPNILDDGYPEGEVFALGGAHWRQVRSFGPMQDNEVIADRVMLNPEYDAELYEHSQHATNCYVNTEVPRALRRHEDDGSDSDSSYDSDDSSTAEDRAYQAAQEYMDSWEMLELVGDLPLNFTAYEPRNDIPGPMAAADEDAVEMDAAREIQYSIDTGIPEPDPPRFDIPLLGAGFDIGECSVLSSSLKKRGTTNGRRPEADGCCKAAAALRKGTLRKMAPDHPQAQYADTCKLGKLTVIVRLGTSFFGGSDDRLFLEIGRNKKFDGSPHFLLADSPDRGDHITKDIDLQDAFPKDRVTIKDIKHMRLVSRTSGGHVSADHLDLEDVTLKATCAGSSRTIQMYKYLDRWFTYWETDIKPEDWEPFGFPRNPSARQKQCTHFSELTFGIQLGDGPHDGTQDTLVLAFNDDQRHTIASGPARRFHAWQEINMKRTFNANKVPLSNLTMVQIFQEHEGARPDNDHWKLQGIKLKGRCAGSLSERLLDKFQSENKQSPRPQVSWLIGKPSWTGRIDPGKDWHRVRKTLTKHVHDEF
ncbi:hypothetical protein JDV02_010511 [Purpureocillium takamizusanense]|uniref:PLAT domain-containing protein n=1 Tax=Purpureocillium takamizusanense TaxID=2060973 RepID=A0A9Q8QUL7_9HYPO|nr:uncharacterized protein JDV02_010511 [Purpureocillium takamizusanense]UNI24787.1 hypothetical protein JDV02_010511 [Purpureocillium takamizusanense]